MRSCWSVLLCVAATVAGSAAVSCRNEAGQDVDWFAMFKFPNGGNYMYADANSPTPSKSSYDLSSSSQGAVAHTLQQWWSSSTSTGAYNDQPPGYKAGSYYAHSKGLFAVEADGSASQDKRGFWLLHSAPNFPDVTAPSYPGFPDGSEIYGQSFLCITLPYESFETVGQLYQTNRPYFYNESLSSVVQNELPTLAGAVMHKDHITAAKLAIEDMKTFGGMDLTVFGKTVAWDQELWGDGIGPHFDAQMNVESWQRGYQSGPFCPPEHSTVTVDIGSLSMGGESWTETQDHSKWGLAVGKSTVCIGDINRMTSQYKRGGGAVCFSKSATYNYLMGSIDGFMNNCTSGVAQQQQPQQQQQQALRNFLRGAPAQVQ